MFGRSIWSTFLLGMPGMDGLQVAAALRRDLAGPLVIIAIRGFADAEYRRQALAAGCDCHFPKPIDPNALAALLAAAGGSPRHPEMPWPVGGIAERLAGGRGGNR
jgi:CheY-like chemotaxis protein